MDLAGDEVERHVVKGLDRSEGLGDAAHLHDGDDRRAPGTSPARPHPAARDGSPLLLLRPGIAGEHSPRDGAPNAA